MKTNMKMTNPNDAAFAKSAFYHETGGADAPEKGLTKREYFAAMAMQAFITIAAEDNTISRIMIASLKAADTLIEELNKQPEDGKETK